MLPQFWDTDWAGRSGHALRFHGFNSEVKQRESLTKDKTRHGKQQGECYRGTKRFFWPAEEAHVFCVAPHATSLPLTWLLIIRSFTQQFTHRRPTTNKPEGGISQPVTMGSDVLKSILLSCFYSGTRTAVQLNAFTVVGPNCGHALYVNINTYYYQLFVFSDSFLPQKIHMYFCSTPCQYMVF